MMLARRWSEGALWRPFLWGGIAGLLAAPLIAMRFTAEMAWGAEDFAAAALLLVGAGLAFELMLRITTRRRTRVVAGVGLMLMVALIWAQGAVGILD